MDREREGLRMEGYDTNYKAFGELIREGHTYSRPECREISIHMVWSSL
jgi:hypothetical protein